MVVLEHVLTEDKGEFITDKRGVGLLSEDVLTEDKGEFITDKRGVGLFVEDVLTEDKGECIICLEELRQGDTIARLPCLCIYHKGYLLSTCQACAEGGFWGLKTPLKKNVVPQNTLNWPLP